jgi:hypothetical protein
MWRGESNSTFPTPFRVLLIIEFCAISFNNYEVNNEICDVDR